MMCLVNVDDQGNRVFALGEFFGKFSEGLNNLVDIFERLVGKTQSCGLGTRPMLTSPLITCSDKS